MTPRERFAANLVARIEESGLWKAELARRAGLTKTAIGLYTSGRCEPRAVHLKRLCDVLGCSADDLLEGV